MRLKISGRALRVIVGAGAVKRDGWLSLQHSDLDIRDARQWSRRFLPASLETILTEHTLEHLTISEASAAIRNFHCYLKQGGHVRCAVPDGFHPARAYRDWVAPGSPGERWLGQFRGNEPPHQTLWNYQTLSQLFCDAGFAVVLREWFDEEGRFHKTDWSAEHGYVRRCGGCAWSNLLGLVIGAPYTSLIIDAVKLKEGKVDYVTNVY
jgi:predicted SAM-dependent methyltransferase